MTTSTKYNNYLKFNNGILYVDPPTRKEADWIIDYDLDGLKNFVEGLGFDKAVIRNPNFKKSTTVLSSQVELSGEIDQPAYLLSQPLINELVQAQAEDIPKGMINDQNIQIWINKAAANIFSLPSASAGCGIDTTETWYPADLEIKNQMMLDTADGNFFEITSRICTRTTKEWKQITTRYDRVGEYLLAVAIDSKSISQPE